MTQYGLPVAHLLDLENWYEKEWFDSHKEKLEGTSSVYKVSTKEINCLSLELVVKNCRVGEDVPLETQTLIENINAEFNSPWEEFAMVMEMREGKHGPENIKINTQDPLAIYVPPEKMQVWQSGRSIAKINRIIAKHPGIGIDILKQYKLIYGWIKGKNIVETFQDIGLYDSELDKNLAPITKKVIIDLDKKGYVVADMKPAHIIISEKFTEKSPGYENQHYPEPSEKQKKYILDLIDQGEYSIVDYELLVRTATYDEEVKYSRRHSYLDDQRDRLIPSKLPAHLKAMDIFGVPYIFGRAESTGGNLWVVGRNPRLFDYFLPERWRKTHSWKLSGSNEVYYTVTKDNVHIVWKSSRVGETPQIKTEDELSSKIMEYGFNSPFEEFAIAQFLDKNGIPAVYARAIYMTGSLKLEQSSDLRRFESHKHKLCPDGKPILRKDHNYISIRGYYNGSDQWVAQQNRQLCRPVDLLKALHMGIILQPDFEKIYKTIIVKLKNIGYDGTLLQANDIILVMDPEESLILDNEGLPEARICNFELIHKY